ncbi:MAG: DUF2785 domain-containing protein [Vicinamibacterales bacterium]
MSIPRLGPAALATVLLLSGVSDAPGQSRTRDQWVALAKSGFTVPAGETAAGLLIEMNALVASPDPVLRDEVAYSAAERWIVRDRIVEPGDLRHMLALWTDNLDDGLGTAGDDRIFKRSFSALCLSLIAARDVATPFLSAEEAHGLADRLFAYLARERDLRGFDAAHGWMHAVAHTSDAFKFLARGRYWRRADLPRLLALVSAKTAEVEGVFQWGEPQRMAFALHAAVRREDADTAAVEQWIAGIQKDFASLWANGPVVVPHDFARVENRLQVLRGLHAALSMDASPTPQGEAMRAAAITALSRVR